MIASRADRPQAITLGGDKGFDAADLADGLREINSTPHIARNTAGVPPSMWAPAIPAMRRPAHPQTDRGRLRLVRPSLGSERRSIAAWTRSVAFPLRSRSFHNLIRLPKLMTEPG